MALPSYTEYAATYRNGQTLANVSTNQGTLLFNGLLESVNRYCGISFANSGGSQQTFTEYLDGNGTPYVKVLNPPIVAVTSVTLLGNDGSTSVLDSTDYRAELSSGVIYLLGGDSTAFQLEQTEQGWPSGFNNVKVIYTGGYTSSNYPDGLRIALYQTLDEMLSGVGIRGTEIEPRDIEGVILLHAHRFNPYRRVTL